MLHILGVQVAGWKVGGPRLEGKATLRVGDATLDNGMEDCSPAQAAISVLIQSSGKMRCRRRLRPEQHQSACHGGKEST